MKKNLAKRLVVAAILTTWIANVPAATITDAREEFTSGTTATNQVLSGTTGKGPDEPYVGNGGAVNAIDAGVTLGGTFENNSATANGGALSISNYGNALDVEAKVNDNTVFKNNSATNGGAISNSTGSFLNIGNDVDFIGNKGIYAGAILNQRAALYIGDRVLFQENSSAAGNSGGALVIEADDGKTHSAIIGTNAEFINNKSGNSGGAIYVFESKTYDTQVSSELHVEIGDGAIFTANGAEKNGGAVAVYGAESVDIGTNAIFEGNSASKDGGAIYVSDYYSDANITINDGTKFIGNEAGGNGGAIYNAAENLTLNTGANGISFVANTSASGANDIYAAAESKTNITGSGNVSIGSGLISEKDSTINVNGTSNLVIEENATASIGGILKTEEGASVVNDGEMTLSGTGNGNVVNNGDLNISGQLTSDGNTKLTNDGDIVVSGTDSKFTGNYTQTDKDSSITVDNQGTLDLTSGTTKIEGGSLIIGENGQLKGNLSVTEAVNLQIAGSTVIDGNGLMVNGGGHIVNAANSALNLSGGDYTVNGGTLGTSIIVSDGSLNAVPEGDLTINGGKELTLSNNATSNAGYIVKSDGTLKLAPTGVNPSGTLNLTENNKITGNGTVLVDEIVITEKELNPNYDPNVSGSEQYIEKETHKGVGTVNIASDNSGFNGNYIQKLGTVIAEAGSKFFGGTNKVQGGTLVLQNGADLSSDINVTARDPQDDAAVYPEYGTVDIYNAIDGTVGEDGINRISADSIANGNNAVIGYINSDGLTNNVNITAGGLGLFNGTRVEGDLTLNKDTGVRDLTFGNGSGSEADSIILNEATKLTYADNAYIKDNSTVSVGTNASLNFANNTTNVTYNPVISSLDETATINKSGAGSTVIASSLKDYTGSIGVTGGSLDLANAETTEEGFNTLNNINVENGSLHIAADVAAEGNVIVKNGALISDKSFETGNTTVENSVFSVAKDFLSENLTIDGSQFVIGGDLVSADDITISNGSNVVVNGVFGAEDTEDPAFSGVGNVNISGNKTTVTLGSSSILSSLSVSDDSVLNNLGNMSVSGAFNIGNTSSTGTPTINMQSGAINTITADSVILNSAANILFDVDPRTQATDQIISNNIISGNENLLVGGINFTTSPIDRNITIDISNLLTDPTGGNADKVALPDGGVIANSAMGQYLITSSGAGNPILNASLLALNPQMYRGQVATLASWQNQLVVNNMLFDHMNVLTRQLMDEEKTANKYAAAYPQFAPYQYDLKGGSLWYKAYGNFERLSMTRGLSVGNNAYGSLIGADFPLIKLKNGWNLVPTAYIAYNGAHQTFNGVSMYQNGAQLGFMGTAYKGDFITSLLAYGGGYANDMSVRGQYGSGSDTTGNWFAGVASKTAYNFHLPYDLIFQPTFMAAYNAFGQQNWGSNFGAMSMSSGMLNGINVAPGFNLIWQKKTFSIYATAQMVYNVMGGVDGKAGNIDLGYVRMRHSYFEYGLGVMKKFKDRFTGYLQITFRNGGRTGVGFQGGLQWKIGK